MSADAQPLATMHTGFSYRSGIDGLFANTLTVPAAVLNRGIIYISLKTIRMGHALLKNFYSISKHLPI